MSQSIKFINNNFSVLILHFCILLIILVTAITSANAANIDYIMKREEINVTINGVIEEGDYIKFMKTITKAFDMYTAWYQINVEAAEKQQPQSKEYIDFKSKVGNIDGYTSVTVILNSNGGNLSEAMNIGEAVREMALKTTTAGIDDAPASCYSACFFIWVSGIERNIAFADGRQIIGIHRIYFNQEDYKKLSSTHAEHKYLEAKKIAVKYLLKMGVPDNIIDKSFKIPSNEVYYLTASEINDLKGVVPYYDEHLISKCGSYSKKEEDDFLLCKVMFKKGYPYWEEFSTSKKQYISKKCNALSPGYLSYLDKAVHKTNQCRKLNDKIERWKRMDAFLSKNGIDWRTTD